MAPWLRVLEAYLVSALLRTPAFHRGVEKVARHVHRIRHRLPPDAPSGTSVDTPPNSSFLNHYWDEIKAQLGQQQQRQQEHENQQAGVNVDSRAMGHAGPRKSAQERVAARVDEVNAEGAWRDSRARGEEGAGPRQGFLGEYVDALRQQLRGDGKK
ncbi:MIOREX complex component 7 [Teratosphaeria destructans]|uniref:MIOREX complex component 7 n=1 Tax=Teratosphaeria destructans TaxID=418781 RepID=A0A9W7VXW1_9PEZI|nr:MIOREX complex component 7 [Teratosphaeria destructans]